ncbi:phosphotransferase family protein [Chitinophaga sp. Cy-1792]|uniref:phosphotransferase family protein n=1 Tax=Chitinophaga sp. Cy-1792 TaxID=2608339 RepID=UPI0014236E94|nr:aminoglycoside phosphotransferase family protein [Chitinophaga sp. Cy-1792]NIG55802.1 aminoglycoside phosphotransferase family protein [Chitinophaga sp. Cy-1792]
MSLQLSEVQAFLNKKLKNVGLVKHIADGWWSNAFYFSSQDKEYIIRFSKHQRDFRKDEFAFTHFNQPPRISIPAILEIGNYNDTIFYCISQFIEGITSDSAMEMAGPEDKLLLSKLTIRQLINIHQVDIGTSTGWGYINENGIGIFNSWQEFLLSFHNSKMNVTWQTLAEKSWLNAPLFEHLIKKMSAFFPYLPDQKYLLHGDFGFDNLLIGKDHCVTAVLDWAEMLYGDPLYDLIHLNEPWSYDSNPDYFGIWKELNGSHEMEINLKERLECYRIHYTLFHLHIHTVRGEEKEYRWIEDWAKNNL